MIQENELAMMLIGIWIYLYSRKIKFDQFPEYKYFLAGFYCLLISWILTVFEALILYKHLNFLEHFMNAAASVFLVVWCFKSLVFKSKEAGHQ